MQARTKRQREIFDYIVDFLDTHGYEPSYQQIARHFGFKSKGGIARHIAALENTGLLRRNRENGSFSLEVLPERSLSEQMLEVEWHEAGSPPASEGDADLLVPRVLLGYLPEKKIKALVVPDNSLADAHILEGDIALIEERAFARDGDRVAAVVSDGRLVFGTYYRHGSKIELRPANDKYESISAPADSVRVVGLIRSLLRPA